MKNFWFMKSIYISAVSRLCLVWSIASALQEDSVTGNMPVKKSHLHLQFLLGIWAVSGECKQYIVYGFSNQTRLVVSDTLIDAFNFYHILLRKKLVFYLDLLTQSYYCLLCKNLYISWYLLGQSCSKVEIQNDAYTIEKRSMRNL
jgi:hypothetical protein